MGQDLTFGQKLTGVNYSGNEDEGVTKIREAAAAFADVVAEVNGSSDVDSFQQTLFDDVIKQILIAQMTAVKAATWKK